MRHPVMPPPREHRGARLITALAIVFTAAWFAFERSGESPLLLAGAATAVAAGGAWAASIMARGGRE